MKKGDIHSQSDQENPLFKPKMHISSNKSFEEDTQYIGEIKMKSGIHQTLGEEEEKKGGFFQSMNTKPVSSPNGILIKKETKNNRSSFPFHKGQQASGNQGNGLLGISLANSIHNNPASIISSSPTPSTISSMSTNSYSYGGENSFSSLSWEQIAKHFLSCSGVPSSYTSTSNDTDILSHAIFYDNLAHKNDDNDDQVTTVLNFLQSINGENTNAVQGLLERCLDQDQQKAETPCNFAQEKSSKDVKNNQLKYDDIVSKNVPLVNSGKLPVLFSRSSSGEDSMCTPLANLANCHFQKDETQGNISTSRSRSGSAPSKSSMKSSKGGNAKVSKRSETRLPPKESSKIKGRARSASVSSTLTTDSTSTTTVNGKRCKFEGCTKHSQGNTPFCIAHGGGRRCTVPGCTRGARDQYFCCAHGGGKRCIIPGCTKSAVGPTNKCCVHGGGRRCKYVDPEDGKPCDKSAQSSTNFCVRHGGGRKCQIALCKKVARGRLRLCSYHARDLTEALEDPEFQNDERPLQEKQAQIITRINERALLTGADQHFPEKEVSGTTQISKKIPTRRSSNPTKHKNMDINTNVQDILTNASTMSISLPNDLTRLSSQPKQNPNMPPKKKIKDQSNLGKTMEPQMNNLSSDVLDPAFEIQLKNFLTNYSDASSQNIDLLNYITPLEIDSIGGLGIHDQECSENADLMMFSGQYGHHSSHTSFQHSYSMDEEPIKFRNESNNLDFMQPILASNFNNLNMNKREKKDAISRNPQDSTLLRLESLSMETGEIERQSNNITSNLTFDDMSNINVQYDGNISSPNFIP